MYTVTTWASLYWTATCLSRLTRGILQWPSLLASMLVAQCWLLLQLLGQEGARRWILELRQLVQTTMLLALTIVLRIASSAHGGKRVRQGLACTAAFAVGTLIVLALETLVQLVLATGWTVIQLFYVDLATSFVVFVLTLFCAHPIDSEGASRRSWWIPMLIIWTVSELVLFTVLEQKGPIVWTLLVCLIQPLMLFLFRAVQICRPRLFTCGCCPCCRSLFQQQYSQLNTSSTATVVEMEDDPFEIGPPPTAANDVM
jgi:hypothetical protein